jgi:hypothetical protein
MTDAEGLLIILVAKEKFSLCFLIFRFSLLISHSNSMMVAFFKSIHGHNHVLSLQSKRMELTANKQHRTFEGANQPSLALQKSIYDSVWHRKGGCMSNPRTTAENHGNLHCGNAFKASRLQTEPPRGVPYQTGRERPIAAPSIQSADFAIPELEEKPRPLRLPRRRIE